MGYNTHMVRLDARKVDIDQRLADLVSTSNRDEWFAVGPTKRATSTTYQQIDRVVDSVGQNVINSVKRHWNPHSC